MDAEGQRRDGPATASPGRARTEPAARTAADTTASGTAILQVERLTKRFGGLVAVSDVSFVVRPGEIFALIGPNGAGKTTCFNMLTGLYTPTAGSVQFAGRSLEQLRPDQVTALGVARTFQNIRLFSYMSALENVMVGGHARMRSHFWDALLRTPFAQAEERRTAEQARSLLAYVGLEAQAAVHARNLPYGLQRRLEIARALATQPRLLLLDEPGAGMNPREKDSLTELIRKIRNSGVTVFLIEHDMRLVMAISDRIAVLDFGQKIAEGLPAEIRANSRVIEAYLGKGA